MVWIIPALLGIWLLLLWWMAAPVPGEEWPVLAIFGKSPEGAALAARRYAFAANFGIRIVIVTQEENRSRLEHITKAEIWSPEEYLRHLETERNRIAGTGNGDYPGCDQRRGVSEL